MKVFLGFIGDYRQFFKNFVTMARPLNGLIAKEEDFIWGGERGRGRGREVEVQETVFSQLRIRMVKVLVLTYPDVWQVVH